MSLNIDQYPAATKEAYVKVGRQFSSKSTLEQSLQTQKAVKANQKEMALNGFVEKDTQKLTAVSQLLRESGVDREKAKVVKSIITKEYIDNFETGKQTREQSQNILEGTDEDLSEIDSPESKKAANLIAKTLDHTSRTPDDAEGLAEQLSLILKTFEQKTVATAAKERNGEAITKSLQEVIPMLQKAAQSRVLRPGTPEHTAHLDLLDGMAVKLIRRARRVAKAIAKKKGDPTFADAFEMNKLYK